MGNIWEAKQYSTGNQELTTGKILQKNITKNFVISFLFSIFTETI